MKRILAVLLVIGIAFSIGSGLALAEETQTKILIDGVKDQAYRDSNSLDYEWWGCYVMEDNGLPTEPTDPERVKNTVWFDMDDNYVYLYFQAESKDALYQPKEGETVPPNDGTFFEQITVCLDMVPSAVYQAPCQQEGNQGEECDHFCCNAVAGETASQRLFATCIPAWGIWEPAFSSMQDAVSFIDYQTNTYGFELRYPRVVGETYLSFNVSNVVNSIEWPEGWELGYVQSFCNNYKINSQQMFPLYFSEFGFEPIPFPGDKEAAKTVNDLIDTIPRYFTVEHRFLVEECRAKYNQLTETQKYWVYNIWRLQLVEDTMLYLKADKVNAVTTDVPEFVTKQHLEDIFTACEFYNALPEEYQEKITNRERLVELEEVAKLLNQVVYGDVNADTQVDAKDALLVLKAAVEKVQLSPTQELAARVNRKYSITSKEALEILKFSVGKIEMFSVEIAQ